MEHRCGRRVASDLAVRVRLMPSTIGWGRLINLSTTGAFLRTPVRLRPLSLVYLEPRLAGGGAWPLPRESVAACVVWRSALGAGLEWCDPPEQFIERLTKFVSLAAPHTAHREDRPAAR